MNKRLLLYAPVIIMPVLLLLCFSNARVYGDATLSAFFLFSIFSLLFAALLLAAISIFKKQPVISLYHLLWLLPGLYAWLHGWHNQQLGLRHYYLCAASLFAAGLGMALHNGFINGTGNRETPLKWLHAAIAVIALYQCGLVLLQYAGVVPAQNPYFSATGSWSNPTVTACFLALSLFSFNKLYRHTGAWLLIVAALALLPALWLLQSRSAWLAAAVIISAAVINHLYAKAGAYKQRRLVLPALGIITGLAVMLSVFVKQPSTAARLHTWHNAAQLIKNKPLTGYGFGQFERVYNLHTAQHYHPANEYVKGANNDFAELLVEGGLAALLIWAGLIIATLKGTKPGMPPMPDIYTIVAAFLVIQLTNYGFQAIPAYVLFLIYVITEKKAGGPLLKNRALAKLVYGGLAAIAGWLCISLSGLATQYEQLAAMPAGALTHTHGLPRNSYHYYENAGAAWVAKKNYDSALYCYHRALETNTSPRITGAIAELYMYRRRPDSALHYYRLTENMEARKISPKYQLIGCLLALRDSLGVMQACTALLRLPPQPGNAKAAYMTAQTKKLQAAILKNGFRNIKTKPI